MAITTGSDPDAATVARARQVAAAHAVPYVARGKRSLESLRADAAEVLVVLARDGVRLVDAADSVLWSRGMAALRLKTIAAGGGDTLVDVAAFAPGDRVLDCTLGLAQDALVASRAVGPDGAVVGLEKSLPLAIFTEEGLAHAGPVEGGCAISVQHADAAEVLARARPRSFDVVMIDPMFAKPRRSQPAFDAVRRHAEDAPLTAQLLEDARRVARRHVVVKGARYSDDLKKLGLIPLQRSRYAEVVWARVAAGEGGCD